MIPSSAITAFTTARDLLWQERYALSKSLPCDWERLEPLLDESMLMRRTFCENWGLSLTSTIEQQLADMRWKPA